MPTARVLLLIPLELASLISPYSIQLPRKGLLGQTLVLPPSERAECAEVLGAKVWGPRSRGWAPGHGVASRGGPAS